MRGRRAESATAKKSAERGSSSGGDLGARIRQLRRAAGWNLSDLSERSRIAVSTLSKVENGALTLNYDRLQQVAQAFEMSLSEFLSAVSASEPKPVATARVAWARAGSGARVDTQAYENHYLCESLRLKSMVPIMARCKARTLDEFGPMLRHEGEEFVLVFKGRVAVHTEYYGVEVLEAGEGVYIDSRMGHAYLQHGEDEAWIVSVNGGEPAAGS